MGSSYSSNSPFCKSLQQFDISSHRQPLLEAIMRNKCFTEDHMGTWIEGLMHYPVHRKGIENLILGFPIFPFPLYPGNCLSILSVWICFFWTFHINRSMQASVSVFFLANSLPKSSASLRLPLPVLHTFKFLSYSPI